MANHRLVSITGYDSPAGVRSVTCPYCGTFVTVFREEIGCNYKPVLVMCQHLVDGPLRIRGRTVVRFKRRATVDSTAERK